VSAEIMETEAETVDHTEEFSEIETVASRNRLQRILAINVALGTGLRVKKWLSPSLYVPGWGSEGEFATVNF
jgi:hypothetical protein